MSTWLEGQTPGREGSGVSVNAGNARYTRKSRENEITRIVKDVQHQCWPDTVVAVPKEPECQCWQQYGRCPECRMVYQMRGCEQYGGYAVGHCETLPRALPPAPSEQLPLQPPPKHRFLETGLDGHQRHELPGPSLPQSDGLQRYEPQQQNPEAAARQDCSNKQTVSVERPTVLYPNRPHQISHCQPEVSRVSGQDVGPQLPQGTSYPPPRCCLRRRELMKAHTLLLMRRMRMPRVGSTRRRRKVGSFPLMLATIHGGKT